MLFGRHSPDHGDAGAPRGREDNRAFWADFFAAVPDARVLLHDVRIEGEDVVGQVVLRGTHTGDSLGFPGTGQELDLDAADLWQVSDSILAGHWDRLRDTALFQQLRRC